MASCSAGVVGDPDGSGAGGCLMLVEKTGSGDGAVFWPTLVDVSVVVAGFMSETTVVATFSRPRGGDDGGVGAGAGGNYGTGDMECEMVFPLPQDSTVCSYAIDVNGEMVDAVVVSKEKARATFEAEVREKRGAAIAEQVSGNVFRVRVFPFPVGGTRVVKIAFTQDLVIAGNTGSYIFPLSVHSDVLLYRFQGKVVGISSESSPTIKLHNSPESQPMHLTPSSSRGFTSEWTFECETRNTRLSGSASIEGIPQRNESSEVTVLCTTLPRSIDTVEEDSFFWCLQDAEDLKRQFGIESLHQRPLTDITFLWDSSRSRSTTDKTLEFDLINALGTSLRCSVTLTVFADAIITETKFAATDSGEIVPFLSNNCIYDGATNLSIAIERASQLPSSIAILFSDGFSSWNTEEERLDFPTPIFTICSATEADFSSLKKIAGKSGGAFFNLKQSSLTDILRQIQTPQLFFSHATDTSGRRVDDVFPSTPCPIAIPFRVSGKMHPPSQDEVLLFHFTVPTVKLDFSKEYTIPRCGLESISPLLCRFWAQQQVEELISYGDAEKTQDTIVQLARKYKFVTPNTSLIVLETLDQFLKNQIEPPQTLPSIYREYQKRIAVQKASEEAKREMKGCRVRDAWKRRMFWLNTVYDGRHSQPLVRHFLALDKDGCKLFGDSECLREDESKDHFLNAPTSQERECNGREAPETVEAEGLFDLDEPLSLRKQQLQQRLTENKRLSEEGERGHETSEREAQERIRRAIERAKALRETREHEKRERDMEEYKCQLMEEREAHDKIRSAIALARRAKESQEETRRQKEMEEYMRRETEEREAQDKMRRAIHRAKEESRHREMQHQEMDDKRRQETEEREVQLKLRAEMERTEREIEALEKEMLSESCAIPKLTVCKKKVVNKVVKRKPKETTEEESLRIEQQKIMQEQDRALDAIAESIHRTKAIACAIGEELQEHNALLQELGDNLSEKVDVRLQRSTKRRALFGIPVSMDDGIETALSSAQTENINVNYCNDSLAVKPAFAEPKNLTPTEEMSLKGVTGGKVWMDDNRPERAEGGKRNTLEGDSEGFREEVFIEGEQGVNDGEGESRATVSAYDRELLQANERMKLCECAKKKSSSKRSDSQVDELVDLIMQEPSSRKCRRRRRTNVPPAESSTLLEMEKVELTATPETTAPKFSFTPSASNENILNAFLPFVQKIKESSEPYRAFLELMSGGDSSALEKSSGFYLQISRMEFPGYTSRILSNLAEVQLDNCSMLRALCQILMQRGEFRQAKYLLEKIVQLRGEEPQSYRDLALLISRQGDIASLKRSMELLLKVIDGNWDVRFEQIEIVALMELNSIIHLAESKGLMASIGINLDSRVIAPVDVDLRCVLTWDTDLSDVELIITEPSGEKSNSFHNHSRFGGLLSRNFSRGYGPVEWMIKQAPPGDYSIDVRLYHTPDPIGTVCASVVVMSDFDRPNQSTLGHVSVLLNKTNDTAHVGVIHVAAAP